MGQFGALLELLVGHDIRQFCHGGECLLQLVVICDRVFAGVLIDCEYPTNDIRVILQKLFADVENAPGVGIRLAVEQFRAVLDFRLGHHGIEARPRIDIAADQRGLAVGMLQQHRRDVLLSQAGAEQRAHQEDVRIGAARHRDALAFQIGDGCDPGILGRDQRGPFRTRINVDRLDRIAVDPGDQRRRARGRAEIDRAGIEELERLVGTGRLHPDDADAVLGEFLFQESVLLQDHRHRIVGRPVDVNFLQRIGGISCSCAGQKHPSRDHRSQSAP